eukprot:405033_1
MEESIPAYPTNPANSATVATAASTTSEGKLMSNTNTKSGPASTLNKAITAKKHVKLSNVPTHLTEFDIFEECAHLGCNGITMLPHSNEDSSETRSFILSFTTLEGCDNFVNKRMLPDILKSNTITTQLRDAVHDPKTVSCFVKNVPRGMSEHELTQALVAHGIPAPRSVSYSVAPRSEKTTETAKHMGYGYLVYSSVDEAKQAMATLSKNPLTLVPKRPLIINEFVPKHNRSLNFTNVIMRGLPATCNKEILSNFLKFNNIEFTTMLVKAPYSQLSYTNGMNTSHAFVNLKTHEMALH